MASCCGGRSAIRTGEVDVWPVVIRSDRARASEDQRDENNCVFHISHHGLELVLERFAGACLHARRPSRHPACKNVSSCCTSRVTTANKKLAESPHIRTPVRLSKG